MPVTITSVSFNTFENFPAGVFQAVAEPDQACIMTRHPWSISGYMALHTSYTVTTSRF